MKKDVVKCKYTHCKHKNRELPKEDAVLSGKAAYYHKDCYEESILMREIIDTWCKRVDDHPIFTQLRKVVKTLVVDEGVEAKYLLFALNYAADRGFIHHIPGLLYIAKNDEILRAYEKMQTAEFMTQEKKKKQDIENKNRTFTYIPPRSKSVGDMLKV